MFLLNIPLTLRFTGNVMCVSKDHINCFMPGFANLQCALCVRSVVVVVQLVELMVQLIPVISDICMLIYLLVNAKPAIQK